MGSQSFLHYTPSAFELRLIDRFQHEMPVSLSPYAEMAEQLACSQDDLIATLQTLMHKGVLSRIGPVFEHRVAGASTLAALSVPEDRLEATASFISSLHEVNHNYQRDHDWNLWFVITAADRAALDAVIAHIETTTGLFVLDLPMEQSYCIDLGFPIGAHHRMPV